MTNVPICSMHGQPHKAMLKGTWGPWWGGCDYKDANGWCTNKPPKDFPKPVAATNPTAPVSTQEQTFRQDLDRSNTEQRIDKRIEEKDRNISWMNAKNCAATLMQGAAGLKMNEPESVLSLIDQYWRLVNEIYGKQTPKV